MRNDGAQDPEVGGHRVPEPVALMLDMAGTLQAMAAAAAAAQMAAVRLAMDRLAANGRSIAESRDPASIVALQIDCCRTLAELAGASFQAALESAAQAQAAGATSPPREGVVDAPRDAAQTPVGERRQGGRGPAPRPASPIAAGIAE